MNVLQKCLLWIVILALLTPSIEAVSFAETLEDTVISATDKLPTTSASPSIPEGTVVEPASTLPGMDDPPDDVTAAEVIDPNNPGWTTFYGTKAGQLFLLPRYPSFETTPAVRKFLQVSGKRTRYPIYRAV